MLRAHKIKQYKCACIYFERDQKKKKKNRTYTKTVGKFSYYGLKYIIIHTLGHDLYPFYYDSHIMLLKLCMCFKEIYPSIICKSVLLLRNNLIPNHLNSFKMI